MKYFAISAQQPENPVFTAETAETAEKNLNP